MSRDPNALGEPEQLELLEPEQEEELAAVLRAAWAPCELEPAVNEALIAAALEDPLAPPTEDELIQSERLRRALDGEAEHPSADLARVLRLAVGPDELKPLAGERMLKAAVARSGARVARRGTVLYLTFGTASAVAALAASWFLFWKPLAEGPAARTYAAQAHELAVSRSTAGLFSEKFETADTTARVDRIALARARDLRSNRYALWGVR